MRVSGRLDLPIPNKWKGWVGSSSDRIGEDFLIGVGESKKMGKVEYDS